MNERFMKYLPAAARFQRGMENKDLLLRLLRLTDLPLFYAFFESGDLLKERSAGLRSFISLVSFRRWLTTLFELIYVMVARGDRDRGLIGFIGLYNIKIHESLTLSIAVFDQARRGKGYGKQSIALLLEQLRKNGLVEKVFVEVHAADLRSLSFFQEIGFTVCGQEKNRLLLAKSLKEKA